MLPVPTWPDHVPWARVEMGWPHPGYMEAMTTPIRLALVDDYPIVLSGLEQMLAPYADRVVVVELDNRLTVESEVDIILLDMFGAVAGEGIGVSDLVGGPGRVVVYLWALNEESAQHALDQGASGCLSKALSGAELVDALEAVHRGETVVSPFGDPPDDAAASAPADWPGHGVGLSDREAEVLALVAKGLGNEEIARTLFLSINSIKTYIRTAYRKIGADSRSQAVIWALENGLEAQERRVLRP